MNNQKNYMYLKNLNNDFYAVHRFNVYFLFEDSKHIFSSKLNTEDINNIITEFMKLYQTCKRTAFNRFIKQDLDTNDLINHLREKFPTLSARYFQYAIEEAELRFTQIKESVVFQIESLKLYKKELEKIMRSLPESSKAYRHYLPKWQKTLNKLKDLYYQQETGKYKVVYGTKTLQENLRKNPNDDELRVEWKFRRSRELYATGDKGKSGNLQIRIIRGDDIPKAVKNRNPDFEYSEDVYFVRVTLGVKPETINKNRQRYRQVYGLLYRSDLKQIDWSFLGEGKKYTSRLLRTIKQRNGVKVFELHVAYDVTKDPEYGLENGCIGIDVNPKFCNLAYTLVNGRLVKWETEPYPLMTYASANKRDHEAHRVAKLIVEKAYEHKMGIIVEDLFFYETQGSKKFNRMIHNFAHRKIIETIQRHACEKGVPIYGVNPAMTSIIGRVKYAKMYGFSVHHGAAYVIARRGLGLKEKIPKFIYKGLKKYTELGGELYNPTEQYNSWKLWSILGEISEEHPDLFIK